MLTTKECIELEDKYGARNYKPLDVVITKGSGIWVEDVDGKKYMDFLAAYSALNQGHCHPRLVNVIQDQAAQLALTSRAFRNDQLPFLVEELCKLTGYEMVLPMNSGAEAVETAIKAVRKWGYQHKGIEKNKAEIVVCEGNFHGRTTTIISFSTEEQYKDGFGPLTPGFVVIPYGDINALKRAINPDTAAFLFEPIQGENGIVIPPEEGGSGSREGWHNAMVMVEAIKRALAAVGWENLNGEAVVEHGLKGLIIDTEGLTCASGYADYEGDRIAIQSFRVATWDMETWDRTAIPGAPCLNIPELLPECEVSDYMTTQGGPGWYTP